jgi:hypothetical protein
MPVAPWTFGLDELGNWASGDASGQVYVRGTESDPMAAESLGCGLLYDVVGAPSGQVAAAVGQNIHAFDATTGQYEGALALLAAQLALSDDGKTLIAQPQLGGDLQVLSWPDGATVNTLATYIPGTGKPPDSLTLIDWSFASTKKLVARTFRGTGSGRFQRQITDLSGKLRYLNDSIAALPLLSPGGRRIDAGLTMSAGACVPGGTQFFDANGQFTGSTPLVALGWLSDAKALTQEWSGLMCVTAGDTRIYDGDGNLVATTPQLPKIGAMKPISETQVYDADSNTIYDLTTGSVAWSSPLPLEKLWAPPNQTPSGKAGAIAGPKVVFWSDSRLHAENY